jgi:hypothetical protein
VNRNGHQKKDPMTLKAGFALVFITLALTCLWLAARGLPVGTVVVAGLGSGVLLSGALLVGWRVRTRRRGRP